MNDEAVHQTIRGLYEGILDETAWRSSLARLRDASESMHASLVEYTPLNHRFRVNEIHDLNQELVDAYNGHYQAEDPSRTYTRQMAVGDWYIDSRDLGQAGMIRLPFYRDFMHRFRLGSVMGCLVERKPYQDIYFSLQKPIGCRPYQATDARRLGWAIPHLRQALSLRERTQDASVLDELSARVLEQFPFGLIVFAPDGKVLLSNGSGERWVRRLLPGSQGASLGQVRHDGWRLRKSFPEMLSAACSPGAAVAAQATHACDDSGQSASVIVLPLPPAHRLARQWQRPAALVAIREAGTAPPMLSGVLRELFGLTPSEIRLATLLTTGVGLPEASARLSIGHETARSQLKMIFNKTETGSQARLAHLLTELGTCVGSGGGRRPASETS
ncbi:helix-turn-helix transcriptional regulator [Cupriavidus sp. WKF15]|uniref:helix-turn-helix transcriptional regulator n=1 Tax=Cupriavidus sp. WKF15 TaxID=3032282 RepID=UPI0023E3220B|nr:helix-turn-helix transcriptional regulator [Cupriavidus sp. WKF15]WER49041.1 helix-turn-helix transcriptional regulator [Cupriavidus sp. WKF15]